MNRRGRGRGGQLTNIPSPTGRGRGRGRGGKGKPTQASPRRNKQQQQRKQGHVSSSSSSEEDTDTSDEDEEDDSNIIIHNNNNNVTMNNAITKIDREERHLQYVEKITDDYLVIAHEQFVKIKSPDKKNLKSRVNNSHDEDVTTPKKDRFGFITTNDNDWHHAAGDNRTIKRDEIRLENTRLHKWRKMLSTGLDKCDDKLIKRRVRKGLPQPIRGQIWRYLSGAKLLEDVKGELYDKLQHVEVAPNETVIIADVQRTFRGRHVLFESGGGVGQERLFNVLRAVSVYDETLGYCSGMNHIVGLLLLFLNEKDAFYCFVSLLRGHKYKLRSMYVSGMPRLMIALYTLDKLVGKTLPKIYGRFQEEHIEVHMFAATWERAVEETRLRFGRTEVSIPPF